VTCDDEERGSSWTDSFGQHHHWPWFILEILININIFKFYFVKGAESRKAARERMEQEMAAAADEDHHHIQGEDTQRREGYHGRDMLGEHLHDASDEWKRRQAAGEWWLPPGLFLLTTLAGSHFRDK